MNWNMGGLVAIVVINLALPFVMPNIDWHAHVGGLVAGAVTTAVMAYAPAAPRVWASAAVCVVLVAVCAVLVEVRTPAAHGHPELGGDVQRA